ncbi:MAG: cysteine peptidase family C39 domain-containing protein [Alphaproteobacteria bacterium]
MSLGSSIRSGLLLAAMGLALAGLAPVQAGAIGLNQGMGGFNVRVPIRSIKEARFHRVVKQEHDFSCGSAALATLLSYHYDQPITEASIFTEMYRVGDQARIQKYGFSLLDMKQYLATHDMRADGFKVDLQRFAEIGVPAITLIETSGYKHFVVVKGVKGTVFWSAILRRGTRTIPRDKFASLWNGIAFVIRDKASTGKSHFNEDQDWSVMAAAPFGTALSRQSLSSFSVHLKGTMSNTF